MHTSQPRRFFAHALLPLCLLICVPPHASQTRPRPAPKARYIPFADAAPVIDALAEILPDELKGKGREQLAALWPNWVARRDAEIRARLAAGDEDSLINFLLFGTSFTREPRVTFAQVAEIRAARADGATAAASQQQPRAARLVETRIRDLLRALAAPGGNDRLLFARKILAGEKRFNLRTAEGHARGMEYLRAGLERVLNENDGYARTLEAARLQGDASGEFAERSRLFRARGLSSDTTLLPNFAVEESLKEIKGRGLLRAGGVRRVAVIGPGLDFTDKQEGYDFYPQQTVQPFAVMDTLLRLGLSSPEALEVVTFDLSPRVNSHLERAASAARAGQGYTIQLPREAQARWKPEAVGYWERFGDRIGAPARPINVPVEAGALQVRAVSVRSQFAARVTPVDTNIILQRLELRPDEQFDLIVATNIFVYYDTFDQSLAMLNVERMLRPGALMLSNNALLELPFIRVRSVGYRTTVYSERADDGDHIVWYRRVEGP